MKKIVKWLPWITLAAGAVGLVLRIWLYGQIDEKALLPDGHFAKTMLFVWTGLTVGALGFLIQPLNPVKNTARLYPASIFRAVGCGAGAAGILSAVLFSITGYQGALDLFVILTGLLAAVSLGYTAFLRLQGRRPGLLMEVATAAFFVVYAVSRCRVWGTEPQLVTYFFPLLACISLMIHTYDLAAHSGKRKHLVFFNQLALYFCVVSLNEQNWSFYLGMAIWMLLDVCTLDCKRVRIEQPPEEAVE